MKKIFFSVIFTSLISFAKCNDMHHSIDFLSKYQNAKDYFNEQKYVKTISILKKIIPVVPLDQYTEESLYMLSKSYYEQQNYTLAEKYFTKYSILFTKGTYIESVHFYIAYISYLKIVDPRLDPSHIYKVICQLQKFLENYQQGEKKNQVQQMIFELKERLAVKALLSAKLYYELGDGCISYPFSKENYISCIITAQNALQTYTHSIYREDFKYYILKSKYEIFKQNIKTKETTIRPQDLIDEYSDYVLEYPTSKYYKEIKKLQNNIINLFEIKLKTYELSKKQFRN